MANKRLLKQILATDHPELLPLLEEEKPDALTGILEKITLMKGDDGYAPVKGVDYFDGEDGDDGENYLLTEEDKAEIAAQIEVPVVKQIIQKTETIKEIPIVKEVAVRDTAKQVAEKLNTLEGALEASVIKDLPSFESFLKKIKKEKLIEMRDVSGMPLNMNDMRWHGGGISNITGLIQAGSNITITGLGTTSSPYIINSTGGGGSYSILTATGTIDDSNTAFVFTKLPTELVINGSSYIQTGGAITWTWNAGTLTATLSSPVGTGGSIYGRV